jgi:MGT family glycosyltransferase
MNVKIYTFPFWGHTEQAIHIANRLYELGAEVSMDINLEYIADIRQGIAVTECKYKLDRQMCESNAVSKDSLIGYAESILQCTAAYIEDSDMTFSDVDMVIFDSFAFWGQVLAKLNNKKAVSLMTLQPFEEADFTNNAELILKQYRDLFANKREFERMLHIYEVTARMRYSFCSEFSFGNLFCAKGCTNFVMFPRHMSYFSASLGKQYIWGRAFSNAVAYSGIKDEGCAYVAFGSILESRELLVECIDVLLENGYEVYAKAGRYFDELYEYYAATENRVNLFKYAPQKEILAKSVLFITHGGMNSVMEALIAQTPMIVIPLANDELINGRMVTRNFYGLVYERSAEVEKNILSNLVREIQSNGLYRRRLKEDALINSECALDRICAEIRKD